jgi:hypothetical protein
MEEDKEVKAMAAVNAALIGLEPDAASRVLRWAADRYKVALPGAAGRSSSSGKGAIASEEAGEQGDNQEYEHFSDFYDAADPATDADRVLVAGYWFQELKGQGELESQALNKELKNTGHAVTHMPHALDDLMNVKPRLMIQLKKKGSTRQARRKFKLTTEGIKKVRGMLKPASE